MTADLVGTKDITTQTDIPKLDSADSDATVMYAASDHSSSLGSHTDMYELDL